MYAIYTDTEYICRVPSIKVAKQRAITLFKEKNVDIFVWREKEKSKPELIFEVIDETRQ